MLLMPHNKIIVIHLDTHVNAIFFRFLTDKATEKNQFVFNKVK